jgi:hypothetical protein
MFGPEESRNGAAEGGNQTTVPAGRDADRQEKFDSFVRSTEYSE